MFEIWGINFYGYGLLIGVGVWLAMEIAIKMNNQIDKKRFESAMWWAIGGGILGARVYHVVDYWQRYYSTNFEKIFYLWEGGLGIWGALLGGIIFLALYCHFNKLNFGEMADSMIVGVPLAQTLGRVGNFINGELYGKNGEPLFLYEGVLNLFLFGLLWQVAKKTKGQGRVVGSYLFGYGVIRMILENLRPENSIWKFNGVPVAVIFGGLATLVGFFLVFRKK